MLPRNCALPAVGLTRTSVLADPCGGTGVEGEWSRAELEEHVRDEHSMFTWLLEPMIARCGFDIEEAVYSDDGIFAQYVLRAD